jgi:hypothetical protein
VGVLGVLVTEASESLGYFYFYPLGFSLILISGRVLAGYFRSTIPSDFFNYLPIFHKFVLDLITGIRMSLYIHLIGFANSRRNIFHIFRFIFGYYPLLLDPLYLNIDYTWDLTNWQICSRHGAG